MSTDQTEQKFPDMSCDSVDSVPVMSIDDDDDDRSAMKPDSNDKDDTNSDAMDNNDPSSHQADVDSQKPVLIISGK
jgi:hypothetical protein